MLACQIDFDDSDLFEDQMKEKTVFILIMYLVAEV